MLQLAFTPVLATDGRSLTLRDDTPPYNALTAPGGYGLANPTPAQLSYFAVLGRHAAGTLHFDATVYADLGSPLRFTLPGDGIYTCWVLAALRNYPPVNAPVGTLCADPVTGDIYFINQGGNPQPFIPYPIETLRSFQPPLLPAAEWVGVSYSVKASQVLCDQVLLEYTRIGSRNRPQRGQDYAGPWLLAQATLSSIKVLVDLARYPEAAAQLAALGAQLGDCCNQTDLLTRGQHTDWVRESQNPGLIV